MKNVDLLRSVNIFAQVSEDDLLKISGLLKEKRVNDDTIIFRQGDPGDALYLVASGRVKATTVDSVGRERELGYFSDGQSFGEMALVTGEPRSATAQAATDAKLLVLRKEDFDVFVAHNIHVMLQTMKVIAQQQATSSPRPAVEHTKPVPPLVAEEAVPGPVARVEPAAPAPLPAVEQVVLEPGPSVEQVVSIPRPAGQEVVSPPQPAVDQVVPTAQPAVEQVAVEPGPSVEQVVSTAQPAVEQVEIISSPDVADVATVAPPAVEQVVPAPQPAVVHVPRYLRPDVQHAAPDIHPPIEGPVEETPSGRVFTVFSPKGGVGKTTMAVNLAVALAHDYRDSVALLDLSLTFSHATLLLNLTPRTSLSATTAEALRRMNSPEELGYYLTIHPSSSLRVLVGAMRPEDGEIVTGEMAKAAIAQLRRQFAYVVVDTESYFSDPVLAALESADKVLLLCSPEITSLKDVRECQRIFNGVVPLPKKRVGYVMNDLYPFKMLSRGQFEEALQQELFAELPYGGDVPPRAALRGEAFLETQSGSPLSRSLQKLATQLVLEEAGAAHQERRRRFFR